MSIRTRFAPSPTGYLHIGGVRTALFNWLLAKQAGGQFILRIDDTDAGRNVAQALRPILDGFRWLGIDWDEGPTPDGSDSKGAHGPCFQSQRQELYAEAVSQLLAGGFAYRDYARPDEVQAQREAARAAGTSFVYDRSWMAETDEQAAAFEAEGRTSVVKLKMPREGKCIFDDHIRGQMEFDWHDEQDHVIQRADGSCLYNLATVVDDHAMEITHVVRAVEHLSNTPRQIYIARSLGYDPPEYAHLPFVAEPNGTAKLSKRKLDKYQKLKEFAELCRLGESIARRADLQTQPETFNPVIVDFYQQIGFLPDGLLNYLLLLGWSLDDHTEDFTRDEMLKSFSLQRVNKAPASFDPQKLLAFQTRWMQKLSVEQRAERCRPFLEAAGLIEAGDAGGRVEQVVAAAGDRIKVAGDILDYDDFFVSDTALTIDDKAFQKRLVNDPEAVAYLREFRDRLAELDRFGADDTEACLNEFLQTAGIKHKQIIHALRVATTGKAVGFGMFETLAILGQSRALNRIDLMLSKLSSSEA